MTTMGPTAETLDRGASMLEVAACLDDPDAAFRFLRDLIEQPSEDGAGAWPPDPDRISTPWPDMPIEARVELLDTYLEAERCRLAGGSPEPV